MKKAKSSCGEELYVARALQESGDSDESEEEVLESVPVIGRLFDEDTGHEEEEPLLAAERFYLPMLELYL